MSTPPQKRAHLQAPEKIAFDAAPVYLSRWGFDFINSGCIPKCIHHGGWEPEARLRRKSMESMPQAAAAPNPGLVFETLTAFQRSAALRTAIEIDLFRGVGEGPGDVASLAKHCSASERGIRILCDYLTVIGLLAKEGNRYHHTPTSGLFLDPRSPACLATMARFIGNPAMNEPFTRLTEIVRNGHTVLPGQGSVEPENPVWVEFAHSMAPMMAPMAAPLGTIVLDGRNGPVRVLDIAAGHGLFGIEVAKQNPKAQIVAVDWAPVLEVAHANAKKAGVADRYTKLPGSAFEVEYGGPYDIVLLTNFLHHFDPPTNTGLLKKVHAALKPGGRAAALEFVPNEDRVSPPMAAAFSMVMLASTPSGDAYTFRELETMYREAGFGDITAHPVPSGPHTVVVGHKS
jgi:SAM-dependent methyltransferase